MLGKFVQSTAKNFLSLRYGLDKLVLKLKNQYDDLIKNQKDSVCKRDNSKLRVQINKIISSLKGIIKIIQSILTVLKKILQFTKFVKKLLAGLTVLVKILKFFPLPARWAIVGMIVKLGDLLSKISFQLKSALLVILGIDFVVSYMSRSLSTLIIIIQDLISKLTLVATQLLACPEDSSGLREELGNELQSNLDDLSSALRDLTDQFGDMLNSPNSYKGFTFVIIEEETVDIVVAKRRYAVAINSSGVLALEGNLSFATDTQVLIDELKLKIDNNNMTGYTDIQPEFEIDEAGNMTVDNENIETFNNSELETEALSDLGYSSIEEIESEARESNRNIQDLLNQDPNEKKLQSNFNSGKQRFVQMLDKKARSGDSKAKELLSKINNKQLSIEDARSKWLEDQNPTIN